MTRKTFLVLLLATLTTTALLPTANAQEEIENYPTAVLTYAASASGEYTAVGIADGGDKLENTNQDTWFYYHNGQQQWSGSNDAPDCLFILLDDCKSHTDFLALSDNGKRLLIASNHDDETHSLKLVTISGGETAQYTINETLLQLEFSPDGEHLYTRTETTLTAYTWEGTTLWQHIFEETGSVAFNHETEYAYAKADGGYHIIDLTSGEIVKQTSSNGQLDTQYMNSAHWTIQARTDGTVKIFKDDSSVFSRRPTTQAYDSAIINDNYALAINRDGYLYQYELTGTDAKFMGKVWLNKDIKQPQLHYDSQYLSTHSGTELGWYKLTGASLNHIATFEVNASTYYVDEVNHQITYPQHNSINHQQFEHTIDHDATLATSLTPTQPAKLNVTLTNNGHLDQEVQLLVSSLNPGLAVALPAKINLGVGQTEVLTVGILTAQTTAAGDYLVPLTVKGDFTTTTLNVTATVQTEVSGQFETQRFTSMGPGDSQTILLEFTNTGNADIDTPLSVIQTRQWNVSIPEQLTVEVAETVTVPVTVTIPSDEAELMRNTLTITLDKNQDIKHSFDIVVGADYSFTLQAPKTATTKTYEYQTKITVTNTGNLPNDIQLSLAGTKVYFPDNQTQYLIEDLAPGEQATVTIEARSLGGGDNEITITATSQHDPSQHEEHTLTVNYQPPPPIHRDDDKDTPSLAVPMLFVALLGAAVLLRRRGE